MTTSLSVKNRFPTLDSIVTAPAKEGDDPAANDRSFPLTNAASNELGVLLEEGLIESDGGMRSCGADTYLLFDGMLRVRLGANPLISAKDMTRSNEDGAYMLAVTGTERGPWWKALRDAVRVAIAQDLEKQHADETLLGNTWAVPEKE